MRCGPLCCGSRSLLYLKSENLSALEAKPVIGIHKTQKFLFIRKSSRRKGRCLQPGAR